MEEKNGIPSFTDIPTRRPTSSPFTDTSRSGGNLTDPTDSVVESTQLGFHCLGDFH
jgi:hypothetical protein